MTAIVGENLLKRYGRFTAVDDVSFEVAAGQVVALLGLNGAGKTTTIEVLEKVSIHGDRSCDGAC
jgi:ABC-2 type transport system ATP-binding protein